MENLILEMENKIREQKRELYEKKELLKALKLINSLPQETKEKIKKGL